MDRLKKLTFRGIPDEVLSLRPIVWRLLLGVFPPEPKKWLEE